MRRFRLTNRRPSAATVLSCVALFVALGGTSYAAVTVTSANIKNNDVASVDLKNNDVQGVDLKDGTVEARDVKGNSLTGGRINESTLGQVPSAANATQAGEAQFSDSTGSFGGLTHTAYARNVQYVQAENASNGLTLTTATAECPGSKQIIGGGGGVGDLGGSNDDKLAVTRSNPINNNTDWIVYVRETAAVADNWKAKAYAICADI